MCSEVTKQEMPKVKVIFVGTHKELVSLDEFNETESKLYELVKKTTAYKHDLIQMAIDGKLIVRVNNMSEDDTDFGPVRQLVEHISKLGDCTVTAPSTWLIFGFYIRQLKVKVITYNECYEIAKACGIQSHEDLNNALHFLHTKLGLVRHFQESDLDKIVIIDPQILFDKITRLITEMFMFGIAPRIKDKFKDEGRFSLCSLRSISCKDTDELNVERFVKLLEHLHIIAPIHGTEDFFMPCVLARSVHEEDFKQVGANSEYAAPPLLITFRGGYCPIGLFCFLSTYLMKKQSWVLLPRKIRDFTISFRVGELDTVKLIFNPTYIYINMLVKSSNNQAYADIRTFIDVALTNVKSQLNYVHSEDASHDFTFFCTLSECERKKHCQKHPAAKLSIDNNKKTAILYCEQVPFHPPRNWDYWFFQGGAEDTDSEELKLGPKRQSQLNTDLRSTFEKSAQIQMKERMKLLPLFPSIVPDTLHTLPDNHPELIGPVEVIHCDSSGGIYNYPLHGITLCIPKEAIPSGENLEITIGVGVYGDFNFMDNISPVSAIVWLCSKSKIFKPIEVIIPHFLDCKSKEDAESLGMQFMKASHLTPASEVTQFLPADGETDFISVPYKGILRTQHFCYLCICAGISSDQLKRRRFCIACAIPKPITTGSIVYFYVLYFLDTCIESLKTQLAEGYFLQEFRCFRLSHSATAITADYQCSADQKPVTLTLQPNGVSQEMIDFWQLHQNGELELMEKIGMYPPSMKLTFGDLSSCEQQLITVLFRGTQEPVEQTKIEIIIPRSNDPTPEEQPTPHTPAPPQSPAMGNTPTLPLLMQFKSKKGEVINVLKRIGTKYTDLGIILLQDDMGDRVEALEAQHQKNAYEINRSILREWLRGGGVQPVTWGKLVEVFSSIGLNALADEIEDS